MTRLMERALMMLAGAAGLGALWLAGCASQPTAGPNAGPVTAVHRPLAKPAPAESSAVQVDAPESLRDALTRIAQAHEARTGQRVQLTFGPGQALQRHAEPDGASSATGKLDARTQVIVSASMAYARQLAAGGGWQAPVELARDPLCLLTSERLHVAPATVLGTLLRPEVRLGTATPEAELLGQHTWDFFRLADAQQPGAYAQLEAKALRWPGGPASPSLPAGRNVFARLLEEGRADVALTYCTQAEAARRETPRLKVVQLPPGLAVVARYGLTWRTDAPAAAQHFAHSLQEAPAQQVLRNP